MTSSLQRSALCEEPVELLNLALCIRYIDWCTKRAMPWPRIGLMVMFLSEGALVTGFAHAEIS